MRKSQLLKPVDKQPYLKLALNNAREANKERLQRLGQSIVVRVSRIRHCYQFSCQISTKKFKSHDYELSCPFIYSLIHSTTTICELAPIAKLCLIQLQPQSQSTPVAEYHAQPNPLTIRQASSFMARTQVNDCDTHNSRQREWLHASSVSCSHRRQWMHQIF